MNDAATRAGRDAADALIALGWAVQPPTRGRPSWMVEGEAFSLAELLVIAAFAELNPPERE